MKNLTFETMIKPLDLQDGDDHASQWYYDNEQLQKLKKKVQTQIQ